jgi:hypothetical protein
MASEHHPHSETTRGGQGDATALDNAVSAGNLATNADLHVIYNQGSGLAVAQIRELDWDRQIVSILHG